MKENEIMLRLCTISATVVFSDIRKLYRFLGRHHLQKCCNHVADCRTDSSVLR